MKLSILKSIYAISRLEADSKIPSWATESTFFNITRSSDEVSIVCEQGLIPESVESEKNWKIFKVEGPLDFGLTGILSSIANPLAAAKISIFAISTFDTDYVMVKEHELDHAVNALKSAGFEI